MLSVLALFACTAPVDPNPVDEDPPLPAGMHALRGFELGDTADLRAIDRVVGDATYVALGESIHTSGGFYQMKNRVFRYLVEEHGFRVYSMETPWHEALLATEYVDSCIAGEPTIRSLDATWSVFGVFADESVQDTLEWMCAWNREHPTDPVHFMGWDIQQGWADSRLLGELIAAHLPERSHALNAGITTCHSAGYDDQQAYLAEWGTRLEDGLDPEAHAACMAGIDAIEAALEESEADWPSYEHGMAGVHAVGLRAYELEIRHIDDTPLSYEVRDVGNAQVLQELHRLWYPGTRMAIWTHNAHIDADHASVRGYEGYGTTQLDFQGWDSMGTFLEQALGDDYVPLGLIGYDVDINWGNFPDPPSSEHADSVEVMLMALDRGDLFVDLTAPGFDVFEPGREYLVTQEWMVPAAHFDGLFFLEHSPAMEYAF